MSYGSNVMREVSGRDTRIPKTACYISFLIIHTVKWGCWNDLKSYERMRREVVIT